MSSAFTALDFEIANYQRTSICQVGLVRFEGGRIVREVCRLVRPAGNWYRADFTKIHGIHAALTAGEPDFAALWPELAPWIAGQTVVAHNGPSFDFDVLRKTLLHYNLALPEFVGVCTLRLHKRRGLAELCSEHGIPLDHHDALSDARACGALYLRSIGSKFDGKQPWIQGPSSS
jgi:DNA polymerase-3 subunit epsilon